MTYLAYIYRLDIFRVNVQFSQFDFFGGLSMNKAELDSNVLSAQGPVSTLGSRIFEARKNAGMSLQMLSNLVGVKASTLSAWENDRSEPRINKLVAMAGILGVSPTHFIAEEGNAGKQVKSVRGRNEKLLMALKEEVQHFSELQKQQNSRLKKINSLLKKL
jgi:transcriptional regulator with XRE-family HTH domain